VVEGMTIKVLSEVTGVRLVDVIKTLIKMGEEPKTISDALKGVYNSIYLLYSYKSRGHQDAHKDGRRAQDHLRRAQRCLQLGLFALLVQKYKY
jgi:ATP:corrinoid adenosyltransferase